MLFQAAQSATRADHPAPDRSPFRMPGPVGGFARLLLPVMLAFMVVISVGGASAQVPAPAPAAEGETTQQDVTQADIDRLLSTLEDPQAREELMAQLRAWQAVEDEPEPDLVQSLGTDALAVLSNNAAMVSGYLFQVTDAFADLPQTFSWLAEELRDEQQRDRWFSAILAVVAAVGAGLILREVARRVVARPIRSAEGRDLETAWQRLPYLALRTVFELIPIVVFALAGYGTLFILDPDVVSRVVALSIINASILVQIILIFGRFVLAPFVTGLRLMPMQDETAVYLYLWLRRIAVIGVYGYIIIEAAAVLGLPAVAYGPLMNALGLLIAALLIVIILQNRLPVAQLIANGLPKPKLLRRRRGQVQPEPEEDVSTAQRTLSTARKRLADIWHLVAIAYVAVAFVIWALDIAGGFPFIVQATVTSVVIVLLARLIYRGFDQLLVRIFAISPDLQAQYPQLDARLNRYVPVVKQTGHVIIIAVALLAFLSAWGISSFAWMQTDFGRSATSSAITIAIVAVVAVVAWEVVSNMIERYLSGATSDGDTVERSARVKTLLPLMRNAFLVVLVTFASLIILSELGVNIAPLLAGAGVIGLAIGFGSQALVRDVITGLFILFEDTVSVGDVVTVGGHTGVVEGISIRTIQLRDVSGCVHTVPFGAVDTVLNMTKDFSYYLADVQVAYRENTDHVSHIIREIGTSLEEDPVYGPLILGPIEVLGVNSFEDSAVVVRARIKTKPIQQWFVGREFNRRLKQRFDEEEIEIPFPHTTVYFGQGKDGTSPPAFLHIDTEDSKTARIEAARQRGDVIEQETQPEQTEEGKWAYSHADPVAEHPSPAVARMEEEEAEAQGEEVKREGAGQAEPEAEEDEAESRRPRKDGAEGPASASSADTDGDDGVTGRTGQGEAKKRPQRTDHLPLSEDEGGPDADGDSR